MAHNGWASLYRSLVIRNPKEFYLPATYADAAIDFLPGKVREACLGGAQKPLNPHAQRLLVAAHKAAGRIELPKGKAKSKAKAKAKAKGKAKAKSKAMTKKEVEPKAKAKTKADSDKKPRPQTAYGAAKKKYMVQLLVGRFWSQAIVTCWQVLV